MNISTVTRLFAAVISTFICCGVQGEISLSEYCPPSFRKTDENRCELVSMYQMYDSLQNHGVGGTQTGLPNFPHRYTPQQIDLGRYLFFDPILSANQQISCASCHAPHLGFSDGQPRSQGINEVTLSRSAPSLWNIGFATKLFWDARSPNLVDQAKGPLFNEFEMANTESDLIDRINANRQYRSLFNDAFDTGASITINQIATALAAFQSSLISLNSRYDAYAHGDHSALNEQEIRGLNVFRSFVARCSECHTPPLFTNNQIAVIGVAERPGEALDIGSEATFSSPKLRGGFKVPTLRNIALTAPYMHAGQKETLSEVVRFYSRGRGNELGEKDGLQLHWHISQPDLQEDEIQAVVAFLEALTDTTMIPMIPRELPSGLTSTFTSEDTRE